MMFPPHVNNKLQLGEGLGEVRQSLETDPPDALYAVQFGEDNADEASADARTRIFYTRNPKFIGYRYQIPAEIDAMVDPPLFMNDLVLLPLNKRDAEKVKAQQIGFPPTRCRRMISIDTPGKCQFYLQPNAQIDISVKGFPGRLVSNQFNLAQLCQNRWSYYILFTLNEGG